MASKKIEIDEQDFAANTRARQISNMLAEAAAEKKFDANDPKHVDIRNKKAMEHQANLAGVLLNILSTESGRAWINEIFVFCDVLGNPHVPGNTDHTSFNLGMQNVGKKILTDILRISPEQYPIILREAIRRDQQ